MFATSIHPEPVEGRFSPDCSLALFVTQCLDGIELGRLTRREVTGQDPDSDGQGAAHHDGIRGDLGLPLCKMAKQERSRDSEQDAADSAERAQQHGFA